MKAYKACVNRECKSFKRKEHYKDEYNYCPICGDKLEYVCADCWKVLDHNTEKYCASCKAKHIQVYLHKSDNNYIHLCNALFV